MVILGLIRIAVWTIGLTVAVILLAAWVLDRAVAVPVLATIKAYQIGLSPLLGRACRFHPTCSAYTYAAVGRYGVVIGCLLGAFRIVRCHPLCRSGFDPP
ncbi:hypothetical protein JCM17478_16900 [Thermopirellula anaerolimosa]